MAIEQIQSSSQVGGAQQQSGSQRAQQTDATPQTSKLSLLDGYTPAQRPNARFEAYQPTKAMKFEGSVSGNMQIYFNTRTKEPQLDFVAKGDVEFIRIDEEKTLGLGLALTGNGITNIVTPEIIYTMLDRDYDEDQHLKLEMELGFSHIHDFDTWDPSNAASYNAVRVGANFAPEKNINLTAGVDVSGKAISPYIGLGGRWAPRGR